jgi:catechol 2,3-dioxygenase-like lactoylglutathione lyase family enzyme
MIRGVSAIVLWTARMREMVAFYRALGFPLAEQREGDGSHFQCDVGGVHFAIYEQDAGDSPPPEYLSAGASLIGFDVDALDPVYVAAKTVGARVLIRPEEVPWGRRAVVLDPDGRTVELNEPGEERTT